MTKRGARSPSRCTKARHTFSSSKWFFRGSIVPSITKYGGIHGRSARGRANRAGANNATPSGGTALP
ncbi:MAG: hypothetical protein RR100_00390, partial [Comamonas sp.]